MDKHTMKIIPVVSLLLFSLWGCGPSGEKELAYDPALREQLLATDYLHRPLPLDTARAMETYSKQLAVLESCMLLPELVLDVPTTTGKRPVGSPDDPDYAIFGTVDYTLHVQDTDWQPYDRISMDVYPEYQGTGVVNLNLQIQNATPADVGAHLINLTPGRWNRVVYEFGELPREEVRALRFYTDIKGRHASGSDSVRYTVRNVQLESTGVKAQEKGWIPQDDRIIYSMSGYLPEGQKTAILSSAHIHKPFTLIHLDSGKTVLQGRVERSDNSIGTLGLANFSTVTKPGLYRLRVGDLETEPFAISSQAFEASAWRVLNFIYCQRCGDAVPGIHDQCHTDLYCDYLGKSYSYGGGWHDAGDLSQQTLQTGDVAFALLETAEKYRESRPQLYQRLIKEACWGLRFVLQCRLGDGYHASSLGLLHWTDNQPGTFDDIHTVRKQNHAFDNFLYAAYEAYACRVLGPEHPLYDSLRKAALEDYQYAVEQYTRHGIQPYAHIMEHTYNTPPSVFMATASWAATQLFQLTGDESYALKAAEYIQYTLKCQETQGTRPELKGYFYRDENRLSLVHFIHQSREQLLAVSLVDLCRSQPHHQQFQEWKDALDLYAQYLQSLMPYTAPYYMASSGTYSATEYRDEAGFQSLHIFAPADAVDRYTRQLTTGGIPLDDTHYLKRFPVWFNIYNGNQAIILSLGKAAAVMGKYLHNHTLMEYGRAQLYWTVGRNPFGQSLIYGEGHHYPSMDSFSSGEIVGETPVGIRSWKDTDEPFWPQTNNACYKEVWMTSAGKWLSLIAEY